MGVVVALVTTLSAAAAPFACNLNFGGTSTDQAQEASLGLIQDSDIHFVTASAKAQQGFVDGIVNSFPLCFNFLIHDV